MATYKNYAGEIGLLHEEYRKKGHNEASQNRPASDATTRDQYEEYLHSDAERWVTSEKQLLNLEITDGAKAIGEIKQKISAFQQKVSQLLSDQSIHSTVEVELSTERTELIQKTKERMHAEVDWKYFRQTNQVTTQASYPDSHIFHFALILVFALVETAVNTIFYENAAGLLGGFVVALGVSALNIGAAMLFGMWFRYKNLQGRQEQLCGWLSLVGFIVVTLYCNALFAAFRSQYQLVVDPENFRQVSEAFQVSAAEAGKIFVLDANFADFMSFILFGVGVLLAIWAFYKGYTFDDKYPGHGDLDRKLNEARKAESDFQGLVTTKVKEFLNRKRLEIQSLIDEPGVLINYAGRKINDITTAKSLIQNQIQAIQLDFASVLGAYRGANAAVRATAAPTYFQVVPDFNERIDLKAGNAEIESLEELQKTLESLRDKYQDQLNQKLLQIQDEGASVMTTTMPEFFKSVSAEAEDAITRSVPTSSRVA